LHHFFAERQIKKGAFSVTLSYTVGYPFFSREREKANAKINCVGQSQSLINEFNCRFFVLVHNLYCTCTCTPRWIKFEGFGFVRGGKTKDDSLEE